MELSSCIPWITRHHRHHAPCKGETCIAPENGDAFHWNSWQPNLNRNSTQFLARVSLKSKLRQVIGHSEITRILRRYNGVDAVLKAANINISNFPYGPQESLKRRLQVWNSVEHGISLVHASDWDFLEEKWAAFVV